ncbi:MAG: transposase [Phycisphaerae bacterium]|nr:transposase [Phycisphaerae bacterium]
MQVQQIKTMGRELTRFLNQFDDTFVRSDTRARLRTYLRGQLSDLPRKSIEPMALAAGIPPRTLQCFLATAQWDEHHMRDRTQQIVAREHADARAIGTVDDTGHPKKGRHTAGVHVTDNHGRVRDTSDDDEHLFPFRGVIPREEVFRKIRATGFDGAVTIECPFDAELFPQFEQLVLQIDSF